MFNFKNWIASVSPSSIWHALVGHFRGVVTQMHPLERRLILWADAHFSHCQFQNTLQSSQSNKISVFSTDNKCIDFTRTKRLLKIGPLACVFYANEPRKGESVKMQDFPA